MVNITIVCCTCNKKKDVLVTCAPQFAFELYDIARKAEWTPAMDMNRGRTLIFCSEECRDKQTTKKGTFRARMIQATD